MRVIVFGNNKVAADILRWLVKNNEDVVATIPENNDLVDSVEEWEEPFLPVAERYSDKIPTFIGNLNYLKRELINLKPDLIIGCRSQLLIKKKILEIPTIGITNIHYGELPRYGGVSPIQWAILNGEDHVGISLHFMNENFDEGPIIAQRTLPILNKERILELPHRKIIVKGLTAFEIYQKTNKIAITMFIENYPSLKTNSFSLKPQDKSKKLFFHKNMIDYKKDKIIDLDQKSIEEISRHIRTFTFPPYQLPIGRINGKIWKELVLKEL